MKYTKKRLQKLAGLLKENAASEEFKYNRVYHVVKHKMTQFLEEKSDEVYETIYDDMKRSISDIGLEYEPEYGEDEVWEDVDELLQGNMGILEMFLEFLDSEYLTEVIKDYSGKAPTRAPMENHNAAWAAMNETLSSWLRSPGRHSDFEGMYQQAVEELLEEEEDSRNPTYHGVYRN